MKSLGQVAYEGYWLFRVSKFSNKGFPDWQDWDLQSEDEKQAWQAAAEAAVKSFLDAPEPQMHRDETLFPKGDA